MGLPPVMVVRHRTEPSARKRTTFPLSAAMTSPSDEIEGAEVHAVPDNAFPDAHSRLPAVS